VIPRRAWGHRPLRIATVFAALIPVIVIVLPIIGGAALE
jgi:hypothetical protein